MVLAPATWTVVSNAPLAAEPAVDGATDTLRQWSFAPTKRISTYITAIVAGPYASVHDTYTDDVCHHPARALLSEVDARLPRLR